MNTDGRVSVRSALGRASPRRTRRWLVIIGLAILLLLGGGYAYLRVEWEGADLGDNVASILNTRMRGRIAIGSVEWPASALKKVVTGGWVPVEVRDVRVWDDCALSSDLSAIDERRTGDPSEDCTPDDRPDPDPTSKRKPRKLLVDAPRITAELDIHAALFGNHDLVFRNAHVWGGQLLLEETNEPYPLHAYDRTIVSVLTAFYPRMKAGFRAGIYADSAPPTVDLRDIHIHDLDVLLQFAPYDAGKGNIGFGFAAYVEDVNVDVPASEMPTSFLHMNAVDPLVPKFYVRLALGGKHTRVRILDEGARNAFVIPGKARMNDEWGKGRKATYSLALSDITLNRLAQMPDQWAQKNYVANTLELDLTAHTIPCASPGIAADPKAGAELQIKGELRNWWDRPYGGEWNLDLHVKNAGPTVRSCFAPAFGGDDLHGSIRLRGPFIAAPRVELDLHGLDFDIPLSKTEEPIRLTLAEVDGYIDLVNEQGSIHRTTALIRGGKEPGEVMLSARFGLKPLYTAADIDIIKPIDIGRFLPPRMLRVGRFLAGKMSVAGDVDEGFELNNFDLSLLLRPDDKKPQVRVHAGRIVAEKGFEKISIENVEFAGGQSRAVINGGVELIDGQWVLQRLRVRGEYPDLGRWLELFGFPAFVQSAGAGEIELNGPITNPTINVRHNLQGIPCIGNLNIVNATIADGIITAQVTTTGLGGNLKGTLRMDNSGALPTITKLDITGSRIDASKMCGLQGTVKGTLDSVRINIDRRTTIDKKRPAADWLGYATVHITAPKLTMSDETYSKVSITLNHKAKNLPAWLERRLDADDLQHCNDAMTKGGFCAIVQADRDLGGKVGAVVADVPAGRNGRAVITRRLGGTVALDDIPLSLLDPFLGKGAVGGFISTTLHLGGDVNTPSVELGSTVNLTRVFAGGAYIGDAQLEIIPTKYNNVDAIRVYGSAMAGQLGIDGIVGTAAPYPVDLALSGRRVEVDHFVDLTKKLGVTETLQAWATGTVTVRTQLSPPPGTVAQPEAWIELTEVAAIINHRSRDGRLRPLRFSMLPRTQGQFALSARLTKDTLDLACRNYALPGGREPCPAQLTTPAGVITIAGGASATQMKLHAQGELDLARLAPLLENQLEDIAGHLILEAQVTGTLDAPRYEAALDVKDGVSVRLPGGEAVLQILGPRVVDGEEVPGAQIKIANGVVGVSSFTVNVKDERKDERGELQVTGSIGLDGLTPNRWGLLVEGQIAGKMLSAFAPDKIAQASGLARIDAALGGTGPLPRVDATLDFEPAEGTRAQPLELVPRGVRRALTFAHGSVQMTTKETGTHRTYTLDFRDNPLTVLIDNEGKLSDIRGVLVLGDGTLDRASVSLDADSIPYRATDGTLEVLLSARDVRLELPTATSPWQARGNVAIVSGSYRRNFQLTEAIKPAPDVVAPAKPFWATYPAIGNADLDIDIEVRKFAVENNIAPEGIEFTGPRLALRGTPREPRMSGQIRVQRGEFKLPATRARFTRTVGTIDFAENDKATNPELNIVSNADYFDLSGQAHTITVQITGTLEAPLWDLSTNTGYDKSQTLALLFLGRTPDQLSRTLGDSTFGQDQTRVDPSTNPGGVGDQLVRDLAGDWVSSLFGDTLTKVTKLDVLRFEIGFGAVKIQGEKRLLENTRGIASFEQTTRGNTLNARLEYTMPKHMPWRVIANDRISLQGTLLQKDFTDPAELDIYDYQAKLVYRLFIP